MVLLNLRDEEWKKYLQKSPEAAKNELEAALSDDLIRSWMEEGNQ